MKILLLLSLLVVPLFGIAYAQYWSDTIEVSVNRDSYYFGDEILVTGYIEDFNINEPVELRVVTSGGELLSPFHATIDSNGEFDYRIVAGGSMGWTTKGTYELWVHHQVNSTYGIGTSTFFEYDSPTAKPVFDVSAYTDKTTYQSGDSVIFSGYVTNYEIGQTVSYVMNDPNGYLISKGEIIPNSEGHFSHTFESDWGLWRIDGNYNIKYHYSDALETNSELIYYYPVSQYPESANTIFAVAGSSLPDCELLECYSPTILKINVGETVIFHNSDTAAHTFTSGTTSYGPDNNFNSSLVYAGKSYTFTFNDAGTYDYFCMVHPWMVGMLVVESDEYTSSFLGDPPISVWTDQSSYSGRAHVDIFGQVNDLDSSTIVNIIVTSPDGTRVYDSITSFSWGDSEFNFERTVVADKFWKEGKYEVTARYGYDDISAITTFIYDGWNPTSIDYELFESDPTPELESDPTPELESDPTPELESDPTPELESDPTPELESDPTPELESDPTPEIDLDAIVDTLLEDIDGIPENVNVNTEIDSVLENKNYVLFNDESNKSELTKQEKIKILSENLDPETQSKVDVLDVKITREQSQYDEYQKQYDYYEGKQLSYDDEKKLLQVIVKLDSQQAKIDSLITEKEELILDSENIPKPPTDVTEVIQEKFEAMLPVTEETIQQKEPFCFIFFCW